MKKSTLLGTAVAAALIIAAGVGVSKYRDYQTASLPVSETETAKLKTLFKR